MKQSTCRCFQRENELPAQVKVDAARGDQRRRAARRRLPSDKASEAIATPCASCACTTSGLEALDDARQPPGRSEVHLRARRDRNQLESFAGAAPQLAVRVRDERRTMTDRAFRPLTVSRTWFWPPRQVRAVSMWSENMSVR